MSYLQKQHAQTLIYRVSKDFRYRLVKAKEFFRNNTRSISLGKTFELKFHYFIDNKSTQLVADPIFNNNLSKVPQFAI
ncbi:hypothetical protein FGO68_gene11345 [Halteria grandinella]|uniref:Uncharacterized protein n=1 Tax=Halteria grandinella TaxID=5974 RepID=A0A8J8NYN1_HALGN|nr:hypothetical protein FGO68_gene11345 [Halteria grandinella]